MLKKIIAYPFKFLPAVFSLLIALTTLFPSGSARLKQDIEEQKERIAALESAYSGGEIKPCDEAKIFSGNLDAAIESGIKFNELSFLATHNSYQTRATDEIRSIYNSLSDLTFGLVSAKKGDFSSETLTDQLNCGIRSFEIDIETFVSNGEVSFTCMHSPNFEMTTSCYDFALALKEISLWSSNNPDHLPITVIIEPKTGFIPLKNMKYFNIDYAKEFDNVLRKNLKDKLFTPSDMLRDYSSFGEMRKADDWCKVSDMLGKVVILLHETDVTEKYIALDPSIKSQAMFPMLRPKDIDRDCTSFVLCNDPEELLEIKAEVMDEKKIMVRTRADKFTDVSDKQRDCALASGANIISTDYPIRTDLNENSYFVSFGGHTTVTASK